VVGGNPKLPADADKAPTASRDGEAVSFVFRRTAASASLNPGVQYTLNQFTTWTPAVNGSAGVTIATEPNGFGSGIDRVTVRIPWTPATSPSIFTRLSVTDQP
jgi:hypothetical protein